MGANLAKEMEEHYKTFIVSCAHVRDLTADGEGLCGHCCCWSELGPVSLRADLPPDFSIPIGYWAIETQGDEPYLAKVSWA
jgi:heterodisulfide reductase subunit A-like polyferredoxin